MAIYEGEATIRQGEQDIAVACVYSVRPPGEHRGIWHGRFTDAASKLATGEAVLILPSGESGRILIDYLSEPSGVSDTFVGAQATPGYA